MKGKLLKYLALFCLLGGLSVGITACNFGEESGNGNNSYPFGPNLGVGYPDEPNTDKITDTETDGDEEESSETDTEEDTDESTDTEEDRDTDENTDTEEDTDGEVGDTDEEIVGVPFVENGETEYQMIIGEGRAEEAALFIVSHVEQATGAVLPTAEVVEWSETAKYIVLGDRALSEEVGFYYDWAQLGETGYYIKTVENSAFIMANSAEGYQLGAIAFLNATVGYDMLAEDCIVYEKDGGILPQTDAVGYPDFAVRLGLNGKPSDNGYGMGYSQTDYYGFIPVDGSFLHNTSKYLPREEHPEWWTQDMQQLCYTARGDEYSKNLMQETILSKMVSAIEVYPDMEYIGLFQEDNIAYCQCVACTELKEQYGSYSGAVIRFVNELDNKLQEYLWAKAGKTGEEKREIKLVFLGYTFTEQPPVIEEDGEYFPVDETVICNENVAVLLCPTQAKYTHGFTEEENVKYAENIKAWSAVCSNILIWTYQTNFTEFLYPYPSWNAASDTYGYLKDMGVEYIFNEGQYLNERATGFGNLKNYLNGKLGLNASLDTGALTDKWFMYYFLDAAEPMRAYFDDLTEHWFKVEQNDASFTGGIIEGIAKRSYFSYEEVRLWLDYIDEAYEAIGKYETSDPALYQTLKKRIDLEGLFPRCVICSLYELRYEETEFEEMRSAFLSDCLDLGLYYINERTNIKNLVDSWGYTADESNWENGALYLNGWLLTTDTSIISGEFTVKVGTKGICDSAFMRCNDLTSITIPDSVTSIGARAFYGCIQVTSITFNGTVEEWNAIEKGDGWNWLVRATEVVCSNGEVSL